MRIAIIWDNCPAILTDGEISILQRARKLKGPVGKKGMELHRKMTTSMGSRLSLSGLTFGSGALGMTARWVEGKDVLDFSM